jgi:hypothetical protein
VLAALVERVDPRNAQIDITNERGETRFLNRPITLSRIDKSSCARRTFRPFAVQSRRVSCIRHRAIAVFALAARKPAHRDA